MTRDTLLSINVKPGTEVKYRRDVVDAKVRDVILLLVSSSFPSACVGEAVLVVVISGVAPGTAQIVTSATAANWTIMQTATRLSQS